MAPAAQPPQDVVDHMAVVFGRSSPPALAQRSLDRRQNSLVLCGGKSLRKDRYSCSKIRDLGDSFAEACILQYFHQR
jgi:hypothetical protein